MPPARNAEALRHELAESVLEDLEPELSRVSAHHGEGYADADDPNARALRERGGNFEWVAFGFDPHPMWDAHVGVLTADGNVTAGMHVNERVSEAKPAAVAAVAEDADVEYAFSDVAGEHQFNRPPVPLESVDAAALSADVASLCRRFEPVVDELLSE
jgi:hypothetical protein